jgi:hypothetical protein
VKRAERRGRPPEPAGGSDPPEQGGGSIGPIFRDVLILLAVFGVTVGVSELVGAANLGVSFGIGQVAFALALIVLLSRD